MAVYTLRLQQYVEEIADVEFEAESPEHASNKQFHILAQVRAGALDVDWQDGSDSLAIEILDHAVFFSDSVGENIPNGVFGEFLKDLVTFKAIAWNSLSSAIKTWAHRTWLRVWRSIRP